MLDDVEAVAARERRRMEEGKSLEDVLRTLVRDESRGVIDVLRVLRKLAPIGLGTARGILEPWLAGSTSLAHVRLRDLDRFGTLVRTPGVSQAVVSLMTDGLVHGRHRRRFEEHTSKGWDRDHPLMKVPDLDALRRELRTLPDGWRDRVVVEADDGASLLVLYVGADSAEARNR